MNHDHYQQLASRFIDREINAQDEQELFTHLSVCSDCRQFLRESWKLQMDVLATKPRPAQPPVPKHPSYSDDRGPAKQTSTQSVRRSPMSTLILFAMVTLIVGLLFSANVKVQQPAGFATQEQVQPN